MHYKSAQTQIRGSWKLLFNALLGCLLLIGIPVKSAKTETNLVEDYRSNYYGSFFLKGFSLPASERVKIARLTEAMLDRYGKTGACVLIVTNTDAREGSTTVRKNTVEERINYLRTLLVRQGVKSINISTPDTVESQANNLMPTETKPTFAIEFYTCLHNK